MYSSGRQNEKATASRKRLRKDKECNRIQKAEDIAEYKGSWPLEKLVDYINNSHLKQQISRMTEARDVTMEPASGGGVELKDRSRKVRKKFSRKEPTSSEPHTEQSNTRLACESPEHRCELEDASEAHENDASNDPRDVCLEQLEDMIFRSLKDCDSTQSPSDFVTSKSSSSSDLAELLFFDDLLPTAKEEEFKVVQRKKKTKANQLQDKEQSVTSNNRKRKNKLEKCKKFIEKQVVASNVTQPILANGLQSFDSFSNSVSVSTFASLSSSVRSSSPVSTSDRDDSIMFEELPITTADVAGVSNDLEKVNFCYISGVTSCSNLLNELDNSQRRAKSSGERVICDLVPSDRITTAGGKLSFCHHINGRCASPQVSCVFVSDPGYPDIVTSTISEFPVSRSLEALQWIPDIKPNVSLPQPDDITEHSVNYSCLIQSDSTLSVGDSRSTQKSKDAIVFGDFSSSEFKPQDNSYCDTKSTSTRMNFEFPMSYSRLRSSKCQMRAKLRNEVVALKTKDKGMCSNPVIFINCLAKGVCDPEISFGFDCFEGEECDIRTSDGFVKTDVITGDYQWGTCLPDLVDPSVVQHDSNLVTECASSTPTCFDICNAYDMQSIKCDSKSSLLNGVDCQASVLSASTDSSTTVPGDDEVTSAQSFFRLPKKICNSAMKTEKKSCILSKWNELPETPWTKRNGHESWYDGHSGFRMKENANSQSENPKKKLTIINSGKQRAGKFNLYTAQTFLWRSECNPLISNVTIIFWFFGETII